MFIWIISNRAESDGDDEEDRIELGGVWQTEIYPQRPQSPHEFQAKSVRDLSY